MARTAAEFFPWYYEARRNLSGTLAERSAAEDKMFSDWYHEMSVGDHVHICHWSDVSPATVVRKTATTLTVRLDKAERDPSWLPEWEPGGFAGVCTNNDDQRWIIEEDPNGRTVVFRWHKRKNRYENTAGEGLYPGWLKKYDYNF